MSTLHEELNGGKDSDPEEKEVVSKEPKKPADCEPRVDVKPNKLPTSHTSESLNENQAKTGTGTPSLVSSGYGSQAASSSNLSSEDSISIKSISVDETPETEAGKVNLQSVLSPPDVSVSSISPGEETDHTMTETTPSSTNITPSQSVELANTQQSQQECEVVRRNLKNNREEKISQRLSCPSNLLLHCEPADKEPEVFRSCRRSEPDINQNSENTENSLPDWMVVGESVQVRPSNLSGLIRFVGSTDFAPGTWIGIELDTSQGRNNGAVGGVQYFDCPHKRGMFVRPKNIKLDKKGRDVHLRRRLKENECHQRPCSKYKSRTNIK